VRGVGDTRCEYKNVVAKREEFRQFERPRYSLEDNVKTDFKYVNAL
jgi:hypothetical protein